MNKKIMNQISFGVDYYPEHWPRERWMEDIRMMKELGIQLVRMGEFSWCKFERNSGEYEFEWLDEVIDMLGKAGIYTLLGTPTAAPPSWLIEEDSEILPMDSNGNRKGFGGRHHDCMSNHHYRGAIKSLVTELAYHYKDNTWVIGWQIDNELGNSHEDLCMCPSCERSFQRWLKQKYKTITCLNEKWGTVFWSQEYHDFSQIPAPKVTPNMHNPSLELDWKRFASDLVNDFLKMQVDIIRKISPDKMLTHNLMGFYDKTDYFKIAQLLDVAGNDQYPTGYYFEQPGQPTWEVSACYDFIRSVKKKPFWMIEMQAGATGGKLIGRNPKPGQLKLWTAQSVAHGADAIIYFRWRNCLFGTEQYWHGILPHSGVPGRTYKELKDTIQTLKPVMEKIKGSMPQKQVGILFSYNQDWALQVQPHHPEYSYMYQVHQFYKWCSRSGLSVDFLGEDDSLDGYPLVFAPLCYLTTEHESRKLENYTQKGGNLVFSTRAGVKDKHNVCLPQILPGPYKVLLGLYIPEYDCLWEEKIALIDTTQGERGEALIWSDCIELDGAEGILSFGSGLYQGKPAVTRHFYGDGTAWYIGGVLDEKAGDWLMEYLCRESGLPHGNMGDLEVESVIRNGEEEDVLFILNHSNQIRKTEVPEQFGRSEAVELAPYEVKIIRRKKKDE